MCVAEATDRLLATASPAPMTYRRILVRRWSRRDRLAVVIVAVTVAFLTGSTLFIGAASDQPLALADSHASSGTATVLDAAEPSDDDVIVQVAHTTRADGTNATVVGVPDDAAESMNISSPPDTGILYGEEAADSVHLDGESGSVEATVERRDERSLFPPHWYVANSETVSTLGTSDALVITDDETQVPAAGVPLRSVLGFFIVGQSQLLATMGAIVVGGAILVTVIVYSVTLMSVHDRLETIRTVRATGATVRDVVWPFTLRAAVLTATGVALGYALGVILPNAALSAAVFMGYPTAIDLGVTARVLSVLLPTYLGLALLGALAGAFAAWSASRELPARLSSAPERRRTAGLVLLDWRTIVPTTATLSVYLTVLFVVSALAVTAAPVATTDGSTISEPGTAHPVGSQLPAEYADVLRGDGFDASAEVVGFAVVDGTPFLTRGAEYEAFATVTDATLEEGRAHRLPDEAVVGSSLARTLDVGVGDSLTLGGSTHDGVSRVTIVGIYTAPGAHEDQLVLSLPTAQHLAGLESGTVNVIRTAQDIESDETTSPITVLDVSAPNRAVANDTVALNVTLRNHDSGENSHALTATLADERVNERIQFDANEQRTVELSLPTGEPGTAPLAVNGGPVQRIAIVHPEAPQLHGVPDKIPPESEPVIEVRTADDTPLANVSVRFDGETVETRSDGRVRLPGAANGTYEVRAETEHGVATETVEVGTATDPDLVASVHVASDSSVPFTSSEARVVLYNPWNESLEKTVRVIGPDTTFEEDVTLAPGDRTELETSLARQPSGTYEVRVETDGEIAAETSYEVSGDDRVVAALASSGKVNGGSDLDQAIEAAVGNLTLFVVTLSGLAAVMTVGGLSASIARAVHARRQTIGVHRAVGANRIRVLRSVVRDALLIGALASASAVGISLLSVQLLETVGLLTVYGIRLPAVPPTDVVLLGLITGIGLTLCSAALAVSSLLTRRPAAVLTDENRPASGGETSES